MQFALVFAPPQPGSPYFGRASPGERGMIQKMKASPRVHNLRPSTHDNPPRRRRQGTSIKYIRRFSGFFDHGRGPTERKIKALKSESNDFDKHRLFDDCHKYIIHHINHITGFDWFLTSETCSPSLSRTRGRGAMSAIFWNKKIRMDASTL